ncbi:MAG TPA: hypothetical protein VMI94_26735 [Bryobacteraceae bacterium]|nr:hypothetical protein [Bryobacteraceae bacterium]
MKRRTRIAVRIEERLVIRTRPYGGAPDDQLRPSASRLRDRLRSLFEDHYEKDKTKWNEE